MTKLFQLQRLALDALDGGPEPMGHDPAQRPYFYVRAQPRLIFLAYYLTAVRAAGGMADQTALRIWVALLDGHGADGSRVAVDEDRHTGSNLTVPALNGGHAIFFDAPGRAENLSDRLRQHQRGPAFRHATFLRGQGRNRLETFPDSR